MMSGTPTSDTRTFPSVPDSGGKARLFVGHLLDGAGAPDDVIVDLQLIASELVANAVEHGDGREVTVSVDVAGAAWWVLLVQCGVARDSLSRLVPEEWSIAAPADRSGRGLGIVRHLADDIHVDVDLPLLAITCRRRR